MKKADRYERILRWYPENWRHRYAEGLAALLEDTYGGGPLPLRARASLARAGTIERAREAGVMGETASSNERLRAGSHLVLCGWSVFVVAGAIFAKFTEHWNVATPSAHRSLPSVGYIAVQWSGLLGVSAVLLAAIVVAPTLVRHVRAQGWASVRRPILRASFAITTAAAFTAGLAVWARHLSADQRNGGAGAFTAGVVVTGIAVLIALVTSTSTSITVTRRLDIPRRLLQVLASVALGLTVSMGVIAMGMALWWANEATFAPYFLANSIGSGVLLTSSTLPPALLLAGGLMVAGLSCALAGSLRVVGGFTRV